MALAEHTTKVFDSDLQELSRTIAEMGGLAEKQIAEANDARQRSRAADNCCGTPQSMSCSTTLRKGPVKPLYGVSR